MNANAENTATTKTETITPEQWDEIFSQLSGKLRRRVAGMPRSRAQWLIGDPNKRIIEPVSAVLLGEGREMKTVEVLETNIPLEKGIQHRHIKLVKSFNVDMPLDFSLDRCRERCGKVWSDDGEIKSWHRAITEKKFRTNLVCGKEYVAELYCMLIDRDVEFLISLAKESGRITGGAWGGALLYQYHRKELVDPQKTSKVEGYHSAQYRKIYCIDDQGHLWDSWLNGWQTPFLFSRPVREYAGSDDGLFFSLAPWEEAGHMGNHFVLFREVMG